MSSNAAEYVYSFDAAVPLKDTMKHVAVHILQGDHLTLADGKGNAEPCRFCWWSDGSCDTKLVKAKASNTCQNFTPFRYRHASRKQPNVPRHCPLLFCSATPFTLSIKHHSDVDMKTVDISEFT